MSISSLNGRQPAAAMSAYCAAKAGLSMLTQVAALELGSNGIRVNAVAPGFVHTPLTEPATQIPGVLDLNGGAQLRRYPDIYSHVTKLAAPQ